MQDLQIIIVEDEYRIRVGLERLISNQQHCLVIGTYANGQEVVDDWNHENPADLVLTDIKMPLMDGMTLIRRLKEMGYSGDFLVLSGFDDFHYVQQALRNQVADYLLKPVDREQLKDRLLLLYEKKRKIENMQEIQTQKQEQLQLLRALSGESSLADTQWTELFPKGYYYTCQLQLHNFYQQKAKRDPIRFHQELSTVVRLLEAELSKQWQNASWWWWDQEQSFGLLVHINKKSGESFGNALAKSLSHRTFFKLTASPGQTFQELELLPAILEEEEMELKLKPMQPESRSTESISADTQANLHTLRFAFKQFIFNEIDGALQRLKEELGTKELHDSTVSLLQSAGIEMMHDVSKRLPATEVNMMLRKLGKNASKSMTAKELLLAFEDWSKGLAGMCIRSETHTEHTTVERAKGFILHHLQDSLTIEQVASHVYMNPTYFCAYFKKHTNETVLQYVTKQRLELAKQKLEETDDKVIAIADFVGYQDHKYFSKLFKKYTGLAPSEYRRSSRQMTPEE